jgi:rhamnosyltransferase
MTSIRLAAIFTTYKPDANFRSRIASVVASCDATIVVDNTPGGHDFDDRSGLTVLQDGINKGLGRALNLGITAARAQGCDAVVLFDQDSSPAPEFIAALLAGLHTQGGRKVCVGPKLVDDAAPSVHTATSSADKTVGAPVTCLATSGMLFPIADLGPEDGFSEDMFLDFVDFDWCWRMGSKGWHMYCLENVPMLHRLGLAQRTFLGLTYHVPAPYRHYFQFRDTLNILRRSYVPAYSKFRLGLILIPKLLVYPFILDRGFERFSWMVRGIKDAFGSVRGVGAAGSTLLPTKNKSFH